ncbi:MAG: protease pro-enzyme activation domain-containing protein [Bryobacteraceae bacterium]
MRPPKRMNLGNRAARRWSIGLTALALLALALVLYTPAFGDFSRVLITEAIDESKLATLAGNTRPEATAENDRGAVPDSFPMKDLLLQLKRSPALESEFSEYIDQLTDKSSPNFRKWLTPQQIADRYGLAHQDLATIQNWLQSHGFSVDHTYENGMVIAFSGTAGQIREAFHTDIHYLEVKGQTHFGNMSEPQIPRAMAPAMAGVAALHDFKPHAMFKRKPKYTYGGYGPDPTFPTSPADGNVLVPADYQMIYNLNPLYRQGILGAGQTIVVVDDSDSYSTDVATYRNTFLSQYSGTFVTTHPGGCSDPGDNSDDAESNIDAEIAGAIAPNATIDLATCTSVLTAIQNLVNGTNGTTIPSVMSVSYGECEASNGAANNLAYYTAYQTGVATGMSIFVSSGDESATSCSADLDYSRYGIGVSGYTSTPYNVSVGGTDFEDSYLGTNAQYWNQSQTTVTLTGVAVSGTTATYSYSGFTGSAPAVGEVLLATGFVTADNNGYFGITAVGPGTIAVTEVSQANETDPASGLIATGNLPSSGSAMSYIPEMPWNDSCSNFEIYNFLGYSTGYGAAGFCQATVATANDDYLDTGSGSGGPSGCATGTVATSRVVSGTCAGYPKPSWQQGIFGNPADGVRDIPDISNFAANGLWGHYVVVCYSHVADEGAPCTPGDLPDWAGFGGTSISSPVSAAIQALVNEKWHTKTGNPNPTYYAIANAEFGASGNSNCYSINQPSGRRGLGTNCVFYDITQGDIEVNCIASSDPAGCYLDGSTNGSTTLGPIGTVTVINPGSGYTSAPTCTLATPAGIAPYNPFGNPIWAGGTQATCTATIGSVAQVGTVTLSSGTVSTAWAGSTVTVGSTVYTFATGTLTTADQVLLNTSSGTTGRTNTLKNLSAAINANSALCGSAAPCYGPGTVANTSATASGTSSPITVTGITAGVSYTFSNVNVGGATFATAITTQAANGAVNGITVTNGGSGYSGGSGCTLTGGGGSGATCSPQLVTLTAGTSYQPAFGTTPGWDFGTGIGTVNAYNLVMNTAW